MSFNQQQSSKVRTRDEAASIARELRGQGKKIVFTNGCFDLIHPGHVDYLCRARDLGDYLILGLNSDSSVKLLEKAPNRPVNNERARAAVLAGLACVDLIVFFEEQTPYELIRAVGPDVLVKGDDYSVEQIAGHDIVQAAGGKVITVPLLPGYSTSNIIRKITGPI
jgi:D-glycero-beta-D-manno-heptose 1-phosphate adenylyltransferase